MADSTVISAGVKLANDPSDSFEIEKGYDLNTPIRGFRFLVDFGDLGLASFKTVSCEMTVSTAVNRYREGGFARLTSRPIPGMPDDPGQITLEKGIYQKSYQMYNYILGYYSGEKVNVIPKAVIYLYHTNGQQISAQWEVVNAWPSKYEFGGGTFDATDASVLTEKITFEHEGVYRVEV